MNYLRKDLVLSEPLTPTIFHQPWWLDIACDGHYREVTVSNGGTIVGRLPYLMRGKAPGLRVLGMPAMTHVLGPAFARPDVAGTAAKSVVRQVTITSELIARLPKASRIHFRLHDDVGSTLAFDAAGFSNNAGFTVEIAPAARDVLWRQMRDKTRNVIRRAQEQLNLIQSLAPDAFFEFYEANLKQAGSRNHYVKAVCLDLITECLRRGVGRILATTTPSGDLESAIFTVWDHQREWYFLSTRTPTSMNGAISLAIWEAIQHAASNRLTFDMDGIHVIGNSLPNLLLLTGFGGVVVPRYVVHRSSAMAQVVRAVRTRFG